MDPVARLRAATAFLLDLDGTIYVDDELSPGARELVEQLASRRIPYLFLTNNSAAAAEDYRDRLRRLGIAARREDILTSGDATIAHLLAETPHRSAYVVGTAALTGAFAAAGIDTDAADPDCVVVGFDTTLTYAKLERACRHLFAGKPYFATHPDRTCITRTGLTPDVAAIIAACESTTGRTPKILGKPMPEMAAAALARLGATPGETAIVGDQLDTDMTMAARSGLLGVLVMSGETTPERLAAWPERPPLVVANVGEVAALLR
jgi:4-nitrophenyl phosphatase/NagD protein